jgi:hypothetical protein
MKATPLQLTLLHAATRRVINPCIDGQASLRSSFTRIAGGTRAGPSEPIDHESLPKRVVESPPGREYPKHMSPDRQPSGLPAVADSTLTEAVDVDQIVERLRWTPKQRLDYLLDMLDFEERAHRARRVS